MGKTSHIPIHKTKKKKKRIYSTTSMPIHIYIYRSYTHFMLGFFFSVPCFTARIKGEAKENIFSVFTFHSHSCSVRSSKNIVCGALVNLTLKKIIYIKKISPHHGRKKFIHIFFFAMFVTFIFFRLLFALRVN